MGVASLKFWDFYLKHSFSNNLVVTRTCTIGAPTSATMQGQGMKFLLNERLSHLLELAKLTFMQFFEVADKNSLF